MSNRTWTIASFLSVAMAAVLFGAFVTTQINRPEAARAADPQTTASRVEARSVAGPIGLDTFRDIASRDTPGVVNINTSKVVKRQGSLRDFFGDDVFERFLPQGRGLRNQTQTSLGSGFVIDKAGYVLTNRHVVDGADE